MLTKHQGVTLPAAFSTEGIHIGAVGFARLGPGQQPIGSADFFCGHVGPEPSFVASPHPFSSPSLTIAASPHAFASHPIAFSAAAVACSLSFTPAPVASTLAVTASSPVARGHNAGLDRPAACFFLGFLGGRAGQLRRRRNC